MSLEAGTIFKTKQGGGIYRILYTNPRILAQRGLYTAENVFTGFNFPISDEFLESDIDRIITEEELFEIKLER